MKSKRRLDEQDDDLVNVLRQRYKQDDEQKRINAQQTFEILMNSQRQQQQKLDGSQSYIPKEPSYALFNNPNMDKSTQKDIPPCYRCNRGTASGKCTFCEHCICHDCVQMCSICEHVYCGGCSIIDYSSSFEKVFCLSCKSG
ncbi:hypothetical protein BDA99DRAFT_495194 [Phascolomyces articulosus]|uniref:Uncharacterized protein n=1 Tax=Phascolomyces articulosus TaxID=60185 RepID=A0AAD5PJX3_9FUNG|nr:hypothetical protein BDA99DRAFT_495194 [Phascolomyces articulosus]